MNCDSCGKQITRKDDVNVLAFLGFVPKTFCNNCYSSRERGILRNFLYYPNKYPLNSKMFIIFLIIGSIILLGAVLLLAFGSTQTANINGESTPLSGGMKIFFSFIILIALLWNWVLYVIARSKMSRLQ